MFNLYSFFFMKGCWICPNAIFSASIERTNMAVFLYWVNMLGRVYPFGSFPALLSGGWSPGSVFWLGVGKGCLGRLVGGSIGLDCSTG